MPETQPEVKAEAKTEVKEEIKWPSLPQGAAFFYDDEKDQFWYGIPFDKLNQPLIILAAIDNIKLAVLNYLNGYIAKKIKQEQFKQSLQGKHANGVIKELFDKGKQFVGMQ